MYLIRFYIYRISIIIYQFRNYIILRIVTTKRGLGRKEFENFPGGLFHQVII